MGKKTKARNILFGLLITVAGIGVMVFLIKSRKEPHKKPVPEKGVLVDCMKIKKQNIYAHIHVTGNVTSNSNVYLIPQVSGMVISMSKNFEAGGFFKKGDTLFKIDPSDYDIAAKISRANIAKAETALLETRSKAEVALKEWGIAKQFNQMKAASPLVLYKPQLKTAESALESAKADYEKRLLDIKRTIIKAPFNCVVQSESVELGRFATPGSPLASISGTDNFDVIVSIPYAELALIDIPSSHNNSKGSEAEITLDTGNGKFTWKSYVYRMLGDVDPSGKMPRIILRVPDPFNLKGIHGKSTPPLVENTFVSATIKGKILEGVFPIPGKSIREKNTLWIMMPDKTLDIRQIRLVRREKGKVFVRGNLKDGEKLVLTNCHEADLVFGPGLPHNET